MNFFEHQQQAQATTRRLVVLFVLAVAGVVAAVNAVAFWALVLGGSRPTPGFHLLVTLATLLVIAGGTWWQTLRLAAGGEAVAAMVGARAVDPGTRDLMERRLLNVVEEMALASGTPVPRVYLMENEGAINAFAAGHTVNDAVITVTQGTLARLTRDELQGVIAHEFSHILNGDMRLNLRLIGVLFGLTMLALAGRFMLEAGRGGRDSKGVAFVALIGVGLFVVGYVGVFFGRLIKAGVSRSREYLADASAVQFTRNPEGIGGALRKIGGLVATPDYAAAGGAPLGAEIRHPHAETLSHLFLGPARSNFAGGMLATHPPLAERIRRIYGRPMPLVLAPLQPVVLAETPAPAADGFGRSPAAPAALSPLAPLAAVAATAAAPAATAHIADAVGATAPSDDYVAAWQQRLQALGLAPALADAQRAQLLVLALLVDKRRDVQQQQRQAIAQTYGDAVLDEVQTLHAAVQQLPPGARLPLLDLAMPALRRLPNVGGDRLLMLAHTLILADGHTTLAEFLLFTVLRRRIGTDAQRPVPLRYRSVADIADDAARVLSLLARVRDPAQPATAFERARAELPGVTLTLMDAPELALDLIGASLARLNQLLPLAKPAFIDACAAVALGGGAPQWKAVSCLRSICAALDAPLPPAPWPALDRAA